jgi:prevent-host-death family protein
VVATIPQKELRNQVAEVLRRAEAGEELTITVAGRAVAQLGPLKRGSWIDAAELADLWTTPIDRTLSRDMERFGGGLRDVFAR